MFGPYAALTDYTDPLAKFDSLPGRHAITILEHGRPLQIFLAKEQASVSGVAALPPPTPEAAPSGKPVNVLTAYSQASHVPTDDLFTMQPVGVLESPGYHPTLGV